MDARGLFCLLEDRLVQHDNSRKEIQNQIQNIYTSTLDEANEVEEKISGEISSAFEAKEGEILELVGRLNNKEGDLDALIKEGEGILSKDQKYEVVPSESSESFSASYKLNIARAPTGKGLNRNENEGEEVDRNTNKAESIVSRLQEYLERIRESMTAAQGRLAEICNERRCEAEELRKRVNNELEPLFTQEDARLQGVVKSLREKMDSEGSDELTVGAKATLLVKQTYSLSNPAKGHSLNDYNLTATKEVSLDCFNFDKRRPLSLIPSLSDKGEISLFFTFFSEEEMMLLEPLELSLNVNIAMWKKDKSEDTEKTYNVMYAPGSDEYICINDVFVPKTTYCLKMRIVHQEVSTQWSEEFEYTTPEFKGLFVWKKCPDSVDQRLRYFVDENNRRIAAKLGYELCTVIGNTPIPINTVTTWGIRVLASQRNDGHNIFIGVAPSGINQNEDDNFYKCGWYFNCYRSALFSGPPHNYGDKEFGPRKEKSGEYVHTGDSVGVVMNTLKGELSFVVDGILYGVAFEGIPLDKPLVPCVLLGEKGDSVGVDYSEMKETVVDSSIPVPSNITTKSGITWDSITLTWDAVEGASFYQIETDGSGAFGVSTTNTFTKGDLLEDTEHTFRIRTIQYHSVSEWSDAVKGKSGRESFGGCKWRECPDDVLEERKYSIDASNSRVAIKTGYNKWYCDCCTVIGNTPIPINAVTSWSVRILKSKWNNGHSAYVGVAPSGIDQNGWNNFTESGWYFNCYFSALYSGLPHKYKKKEYGPRKSEGKYVHAGDTVGVLMNTTKGELSFVLDGVNLGVAFEGIPLDKPLVPCVIFGEKGDSAEFII